jgi:hypothetical protein
VPAPIASKLALQSPRPWSTAPIRVILHKYSRMIFEGWETYLPCRIFVKRDQ